MKSMKTAFSIFMIALILIVSGCSKSDDPTPSNPGGTTGKTTAEVNLEKVKTSVASGTWTFKSVTVTQIASSKVATETGCTRSNMTSANFGNTQWQNITPTLDLIYATGNNVGISFKCTSNPPFSYPFTITQTADNQFTVELTSAMVFSVNSDDISTSLAKATLISNGTFVSSNLGYKVVYEFTR